MKKSVCLPRDFQVICRQPKMHQLGLLITETFVYKYESRPKKDLWVILQGDCFQSSGIPILGIDRNLEFYNITVKRIKFG